MAKTKKASEKKSERKPTLQIPCSPEFKADVDDLARAMFFENTSDFLRPIIAAYVEQERGRLNQYRAAKAKNKIPNVILSYADADADELTAKQPSRAKKKADKQGEGDVQAGSGSAMNAANVEQDKGGDGV